MDIHEIISQINNEGYKLIPDFLNSYCIINGSYQSLEEIQKMSLENFNYRVRTNVPIKLYKYFSNSTIRKNNEEVNYSIQALENNTVFMQKPSEFDDVYDSGLNLNFDEYQILILKEYCKYCEIDISQKSSLEEIGDEFIKSLHQSYMDNRNFYSAFKKQPITEIGMRSIELFCLKLKNELNQLQESFDLGKVVPKIIFEDYKEKSSKLKDIFRTSCFSTNPYSQPMWALYSNHHKGFCVEYSILQNEERYHDIYYNLFPMIYCKIRPSVSEDLFNVLDFDITEEHLRIIYLHGALRKSIDWVFQNEWRLLLPEGDENISDFKVNFFPITRVFLGSRMSKEERLKIINICKKRNIQYECVILNSNIFEMQSCNNLK